MQRTCRTIPDLTTRFRLEAKDRLAWFECEFALLSPDSLDYATEKRAIDTAMRELRELIQIVGPKS